jgi:hypothetical protein
MTVIKKNADVQRRHMRNTNGGTSLCDYACALLNSLSPRTLTEYPT